MKIKALLLAIFFGLFITYVNADDTESKDYIIQKGDTLWDISDSALSEPMLWPRLWHVNPQIANPDLIYPGSNIWIPSREELMRLTKDVFPVSDELELDFPEFKPVPIKPPKPPPVDYIVNMETYLSSGWISKDIQSGGEVFFTRRGRNLFGKTEPVFLRTEADVSVGDKFLAVRKIKKIRHPETGDKLGFQMRVTGLLEVVGIENNTPKAKVIEEYDYVEEGDNIIIYTESIPPVRLKTARTPNINGYILGSRMDKHMSHTNEIVYLDKGFKDGIEPGDIFSIQDKAPTGSLQVISTKPHTSAAIILDMQEEVMIGDTWGKK